MLENGGKGQGFEEEGKGQCLCAEVDGQEHWYIGLGWGRDIRCFYQA